ncbi:Unknown protein [Striga hermonthica]|uniref:DUF4216 domain-containing protein n=1 Tax=Striga hermonthica TaxID=68872 RepID=A0A9N7N187_STRHE|nr:Unknown protein [Striga hermonthica]
MVMDAAGPEFHLDFEEPPNPDSKRFYDMLNAVDKELWPGCTTHSQLSFVARAMHMKAEHHMSERNYDDMMQLVSEVLPYDNTVPENFYKTKKLLRGMGLPVEKIDCCNNGCMLYWEDDADATSCKFCGHGRFKRKPPRNDAGCSQTKDLEGSLSVFKFQGRFLGRAKARYLTEDEYNAARSYILLNCVEVEPYISIFVGSLRSQRRSISREEIDQKLENEFPDWFEKYVHDPLNGITNEYMQDLAKGPLRKIKSYSGYMVNGFKFHTLGCGTSKSTMNSGVCIKGSNFSVENDFYGRLVDVVEVGYNGFHTNTIVLFKCEWFDPTARGMNIHKDYKLVDINHKRRFDRYEPFMLGMQAKQVFFCEYPGASRDKRDWWAVCNVKARAFVEVPLSVDNNVEMQVTPPYQEDERSVHRI